MSGWTTVTKQRATPRNVPVAKRKPVEAPADLNADEAAVFAILRAAYPSALTSEDIWERAGCPDEAGLSVIRIWAALDGPKLKACCDKGPHVTFAVRGQAKK